MKLLYQLTVFADVVERVAALLRHTVTGETDGAVTFVTVTLTSTLALVQPDESASTK